MQEEKRIQSFAEFWPFYVSQHSKPLTRKLHFIGTGLSALSLLGGIATLNPVLIGVAPVIGYGFAWAGHFLVERNRPATFTYPLWSLAADWVMFGKMLLGQMDAEVARVCGATN
jgi:hypothetical protein